MEVIIQVLILFIFINAILKLSFWKWWQTAIFGMICAIFVIWTQQFAIAQSKTQLHDYLSDNRALQDMAVLITVESAICFAFCFAALKNMFGKRKKRWVGLLYWYPSLLLFPALFFMLTQATFSLTGINFNAIAYTMAAITFVAIPAASYGIKLWVPEKELRLEVHFLVSLFVAILGLLTTVSGNVTYLAVKEPLNIKAILYSVILFAVFFAIGYFWNKNKWRFRKSDGPKNADGFGTKNNTGN